MQQPNILADIQKIISGEGDAENQIEQLDTLKTKYISKGQYEKAKQCTQKVSELKTSEKNKKKKDLVEQQSAEAEMLDQQYKEEVEKLNLIWDKKFEALQEKSKKAEEKINEKQQKEMEELYTTFEKKFPATIKFSKEYLALENQEKNLVKLQKFDEAKIIKKKKEEQKQKDTDKWNKDKTEKIKNQVIQKSNKHINEKNVLKKKFEVELNLLRMEKQKDLQHLDKKFHNKKQELDLQQKSERKLADNELINKKKQFGLSYMVNNNEGRHYRVNTGSKMNSKNPNEQVEDEKEFQEDDLQKFYNGQESDIDINYSKPGFEIQENPDAINDLNNGKFDS